jgi:integrase
MAQGSAIKHTAKDGTVTWRARADGGVDPTTGKRRQVMKTFHTRAEAQAWLRDRQHRADRGEWADSRKITLAKWIEEWLAGAGARGRRESTLRVYTSLLNSRVVPVLGDLVLTRLAPAALERFFRQEEQKVKAGTVYTTYAILHVCLADAERLNLITANPLRKVRTPNAPPPVRTGWTPEHARQFLAIAATSEDYTFWLLLLTCALRIGEALALKWEDCDLERGLLQVRRTITAGYKGRAVIGDTTKSGKSRTLPLAETMIAALNDQRARVLNLQMANRNIWQEEDLVFPNGLGAPRRSDVLRDRLAVLCAQAKVPPLTPHGLRHTAASLLAEHAPVAVARDVLGHSSLAITNTYVHASDQAKRAGSDALARILAGS